jgi:hypothetical protein
MKKLLIAVLILGTINFTGCDTKSADDKAVKETSSSTTTTDTKTNNDKTNAAKSDTTATTAKTDTAKATTSDSKQLGYVKKLYEESGSKYISIQYVQWLSGEEAIKAIMEDDKCTREEAQSRYTNDYYIRDKNKEVKKVKVSNNANYSIIKTGLEATKSNFDEVKKELGETTLGILCDVTIKDNEVTDLKQKYHP